MRYISTRGNAEPLSAARAIMQGMVAAGGLYVPESIPLLDYRLLLGDSYQQTAKKILPLFLDDFSAADLDWCVDQAYNARSFDSQAIAPVIPLGPQQSILELWHGPTAAFKDMALQIMPRLLLCAKRMIGDTTHTVILVATSGDTGKAALEGFSNCDGVSIIVFFPHGGVSEVQRLQMVTTDGANTQVVAVNGNFDDCQTGVKKILGDAVLGNQLRSRGYTFSSANSINWGRLSPQIVYYFTAYVDLVRRSIIASGDKVNFCVPTGNFGNILAGYYAQQMGLPINKLICASNKNSVLADFFASGTYNSNRAFYQTMSPSMDILISSNLERFLFEITGHNGALVGEWCDALSHTGTFSVNDVTRAKMAEVITAGWVDESEIRETIKRVYDENGYVVDTHTAVAAAVSEKIKSDGLHTVLVSTASPFKFGADVLYGLSGKKIPDEFESVEQVAALWHEPVHRALSNLASRPIRHTRLIEQAQMQQAVLSSINVSL